MSMVVVNMCYFYVWVVSRAIRETGCDCKNLSTRTACVCVIIRCHKLITDSFKVAHPQIYISYTYICERTAQSVQTTERHCSRGSAAVFVSLLPTVALCRVQSAIGCGSTSAELSRF